MMLHPAIAQQLAAERQRDLLDHASRHRLARNARTARAARTARPATSDRARPSLLRWARVALAKPLTPPQSSVQLSSHR